MAAVVSYDKTGVLRVVMMDNTPVVWMDRVESVHTSGWNTQTEVASKKQSWETVNTTTGAITGSNAVTP